MSVIAKVTKSTLWISYMVDVRKPHKLRLCLDPHHLNKGIIRNNYPIPTVEDITPKLTKAKVFLTKRFHVAVRLFSNRSQMTSKCSKNK